MKKVFLVLAAVVTVVSFSACKKTCTCIGYLDGKEVPNSKFEGEIKGKCADLNKSEEVPGVGKVEYKCE